ncbi:MAG TPA: hypothetical protein VGB37_14530 [Candidatus Lokiarchaeia archaeon]
MVEKAYKKEFRNTIIWILFAISISGFLAIAPDVSSKVVLVYFFLSLSSFLLFIFFPQIAEYSTSNQNRTLSQKLFGIEKKPFGGFFVGILFAVGFIIISSIKVLSVINLAIPIDLPLSLTANALIILVVSWVCETAFFIMLFSVLALFVPLWWAIFIKAIAFSGYHYYSYVVLSSSTISNVAGAFIGAFVFAVLGGLMVYRWGMASEGGLHAGINSWNYNEVFGFLTVVN